MSTAMAAPSARMSLESAVVDTLMPDASPSPSQSQDGSQQTKLTDDASSHGSARTNDSVTNDAVQTSVEDMEPMPLQFDPVATDEFDLSLFLTFGETDSSSNLDWMKLLDTPSLPELEPHEIFSSEQSYRKFGAQPNTRTSPNSTVTPTAVRVGRKDSTSFHDRTSFFASASPGVLVDPSLDLTAVGNNVSASLSQMVAVPNNGEGAIAEADPETNNVSRSAADGWNICRCDPPPRTAAPFRWGDLVACWTEGIGQPSTPAGSCEALRDEHFKTGTTLKRLSFSEITRERMLVIAQAIFRRAAELYTLPSSRQRKGICRAPRRSRLGGSSLPLLPPTSSLHEFLEIFLTSFEPLYPVVSKGALDPNELVPDSTEDTSSLALFLMIGYGMMRDTDPKNRRLAVGLVDACQLSLMNLVERESQNPRSSMTYLSTLLCTFQAAFGGDKWLMDSSQGLRSMYLGTALTFRNTKTRPDGKVLLHLRKAAAIFSRGRQHRRRAGVRLAFLDAQGDIFAEMGLFYDDGPSIPTAEIQTPLPDHESLWLAPDAQAWSQACTEVHGSHDHFSQHHTRRSLCDLFQELLAGKLSAWSGGEELSILHLRLLLYPLHTFATQYSRLASCLPRSGSNHQLVQDPCDISTSLQGEEVKELLQRWHDLLAQSRPAGSRQWLLCQVTLILYHLIYLNLCASIPDIESFARGEFRQQSSVLGDFVPPALPHRCIQAREEAIFHCGQVLRLLRETDPVLRPLWWPLALYRVAIVLWAIGLESLPRTNAGSSRHQAATNIDNLHSSVFAIDTLTADDYRWRIFIRQKRGFPCLTKGASHVQLEDINGTIEICIALLDAGPTGPPLAEGVAHKLNTLTLPSSCIRSDQVVGITCI
ncbi:hypothetical protein CLCR_04566 [Cladophialophora carrionii]|uniref:Transcription factor domain-containing protein n=1 Tax=Cladophialophora carrionii TaxID=86049 RepID=A0A1C1CLY2_9EURO|nr:hypothetical protein CLCR_04566 [Cladophialophora carrionii]